MRYQTKLLPLLVGGVLLTSCAHFQSKQEAADKGMKIESTMSVSGANAKAASMYQLGRYYQGQNRFEQAIDAYQKSLAADSGYAESYNGLGVVYSRQGKYEQAIAQFKRALELAPRADHVYNNLGYAHYLQGNVAAATEAFNQALAMNPENPRAMKNLALVQGKPLADVAKPAPTQVNSVTEAIPTSQSASKIEVVSQPELEVRQLAPAVFELKRHEADEMPVRHGRLQVGRIEVANGNGVTGMARKVSVYLKREGYVSARLTNQKPFNIARSEVHYRSGYEAEARELQAKLPGQPDMVARNDLRKGINLRLVLGADLAGQQEYFR